MLPSNSISLEQGFYWYSRLHMVFSPLVVQVQLKWMYLKHMLRYEMVKTNWVPLTHVL